MFLLPWKMILLHLTDGKTMIYLLRASGWQKTKKTETLNALCSTKQAQLS